MTKPTIRSDLRSALMALLAFGLFASHDALVKILGSQYSIFQIIFFSGLFAFVPVTLMMTADKAADNFRPHRPWLLAARMTTGVISMACAFYAFTRLSLAETYALLFATPLLITVLAVPLLGEVVRLRRWIAVLVGLAGVLVVLRPGAADLNLGHLAALTAACGSALSAIIIRKVGGAERPAVLILFPMFANIGVMALMLPQVYQPVELADLALMASVGLLAMLAQLSIIAAYRSAPAVVVAPVQYSQILWATLFGYLIFNDVPDKWVFIGAGIIILSGLFVVLRESTEDVSEKRPVLRTSNLRPDTGPSPRPKPVDRDNITKADLQYKS